MLFWSRKNKLCFRIKYSLKKSKGIKIAVSKFIEIFSMGSGLFFLQKRSNLMKPTNIFPFLNKIFRTKKAISNIFWIKPGQKIIHQSVGFNFVLLCSVNNFYLIIFTKTKWVAAQQLLNKGHLLLRLPRKGHPLPLSR